MTRYQTLRNRGFTLLIAVVLASVATAIGVALASLAYKSVRISEVGQASQIAFYTADTALECALYWDQQQDTFDYSAHQPTPQITCVNGEGTVNVAFDVTSPNPPTIQFTSKEPAGYTSGWFPLNGGTSCARVTIYKSPTGTSTYLYSEGLSSCAVDDSRTLERGLYSYY